MIRSSGHDEPQDVKMVKAAGATGPSAYQLPANHFTVLYGVDTPSRAELIASTHTIDEIRYVGRTARVAESPRASVGRRRRAPVILHIVLHRCARCHSA
jgi:hypothetical protein